MLSQQLQDFFGDPLSTAFITLCVVFSSIKAIVKNCTDGMLPVLGAFRSHGWLGTEPTEILQPGMKTKHLSFILHIDQSDFCPVN